MNSGEQPVDIFLVMDNSGDADLSQEGRNAADGHNQSRDILSDVGSIWVQPDVRPNLRADLVREGESGVPVYCFVLDMEK